MKAFTEIAKLLRPASYTHQNSKGTHQLLTRTTRTPAFWDTPRRPMITPTIDSYWIPSQSQSYKFEKLAKASNFGILQKSLHTTHLLKLLDKMCIYEMDQACIAEVTERTRLCPHTDGQTDRWTDGQMTWNQYTPLSTSLKRGYNFLRPGDVS